MIEYIKICSFRANEGKDVSLPKTISAQKLLFEGMFEHDSDTRIHQKIAEGVDFLGK